MNNQKFKNKINTNKGIALAELVISLIFLVFFGLIITSTSSLLNKLLRTNNFNFKKNEYQTEIYYVKKRMGT